MGRLHYLAPLAIMVGLGVLTPACSKSPCPEGLAMMGEQTEKSTSVWCKSPDGTRARWFEYYDSKKDGKTHRQSCGYSGGRPEGSFTAWHPGGKTWIEGEYQEGRKVGHWVQWNKDGVKVAEGEYRNGDFVAGAPVGLPAACERMKP